MTNVINLEERFIDNKTRLADEAADRYHEAHEAFEKAGGYWATTRGQIDYARQRKQQDESILRDQIEKEQQLKLRKKELDKIIKNFKNKPKAPDHFLNNKHLSEKAKKAGLYLSSIPTDFQFRPSDVKSELGYGECSWKNLSFQLKTEGYLKLFPQTVGRKCGYRFDFNKFE